MMGSENLQTRIEKDILILENNEVKTFATIREQTRQGIREPNVGNHSKIRERLEDRYYQICIDRCRWIWDALVS